MFSNVSPFSVALRRVTRLQKGGIADVGCVVLSFSKRVILIT